MELSKVLLSANESRNFCVQTTIPLSFGSSYDIPSSSSSSTREIQNEIKDDSEEQLIFEDAPQDRTVEVHENDFQSPINQQNSKSSATLKRKQSNKPSANKLVRTDPTLLKIDSFFNKIIPQAKISALNEAQDLNRNVIDNQVNSDIICVCSDANISSVERSLFLSDDDDQITMNNNNNINDISAVPGSEIPFSFVQRKNRISNSSLNNCDCCGNQNEISSIDSLVLQPDVVSIDQKSSVENVLINKFQNFVETTSEFTSIQSLIKEMKLGKSEEIESILKCYTFVGAIDSKLSLIQVSTRLLLVDHFALLRSLFYQLSIKRFASMSRLVISQPVDIYSFALVALENSNLWRPEDGDRFIELNIVIFD
jgi:hypothetical protein